MFVRTCNIGLLPHESEVMPGLSVTPNDMDSMTAVGKAVSSHSIDNFTYSDGVASPSDLPSCMKRGVDMNDNWEMVQRFKGKVKHAQRAKALDDAAAAVKAAAKAAAGKE